MRHWTDRALDRLPGWPSERQTATLLLAGLIGGLLIMAQINPRLWQVKLFELILQAAVITGLLNMVLAFHFAANQRDEKRTENTGKALDAITAVAANNPNAPTPDTPAALDAKAEGAQEAAAAATDVADELAGAPGATEGKDP